MVISPVPIVYTCPLMLQTDSGSYINANNITRMSKAEDYWFVHCDEFGISTKYNINDDEAQKVLDFYA